MDLDGLTAGTSPLTITYTIPLTSVSNIVRIRGALVRYGWVPDCPVTTMSIVDNYGSVTNGNTITWGAAGVAALNAANVAGSETLQVTATLNFTCSGPPPHEGTFGVVLIEIYVCEGEFN